MFSAHPTWALRRPQGKVNLVPRSLPLKPPCHWNLLQNLNKKKTMKIFQIGTCKVNTFTSINVGSSLFIGPSVLYHQERKFRFVISRWCKNLFCSLLFTVCNSKSLSSGYCRAHHALMPSIYCLAKELARRKIYRMSVRPSVRPCLVRHLKARQMLAVSCPLIYNLEVYSSCIPCHNCFRSVPPCPLGGVQISNTVPMGVSAACIAAYSCCWWGSRISLKAWRHSMRETFPAKKTGTRQKRLHCVVVFMKTRF